MYPCALSHDSVRAHYAAGIQPVGPQADRIFTLAASKFEEALLFAPGDKLILDKYAQTLCSNLVLDAAAASPEVERWNRRKVEQAIEVFLASENCDALAEVLRRLPADMRFAQLACQAFRAVLQVDGTYFSLHSFMTLRELALMPRKFSLTVPGASAEFVAVAAKMYRLVLAEPVLALAFGEDDLSWASRLETDEVLCGLVSLSESDTDNRIFDLHHLRPIPNLTDADLQLIADNRRLTLALNLRGCHRLTDEGVFMAARFCTSLQALKLDDCDQVTDKSLAALKRFCPQVNLLSLERCYRISDVGIVNLVGTCNRIRVLNLNYCKLVRPMHEHQKQSGAVRCGEK